MQGFGETIQNFRWTNAEGTSHLLDYVRESIIADDGSEVQRIANYELNWQFYLGNHWRRYSATMLTFNYTKAFIDKVSQFLIGKSPFTLKVGSYSSDPVQDEVEKYAEGLLLTQWNKIDRLKFSYGAMQTGSITGDAWVSVFWDYKINGVNVRVLDSRQCFPQIDPYDHSSITSFIIRNNVAKDEVNNPNKYVVRITEYTETTNNTWYQTTFGIAKKAVDRLEYSSTPNPLGFIPIVHVQNKINSGAYYGLTDTTDIVKLNKTYNELAQQYKGIVDYHSSPTTIVTGANMGDTARKLGGIWSGFPPEANIFNLGLDVDLSAMQNFLHLIKTALHELSGVPENYLGKIQSISHTSAAALQLTFQPLVQQADLKAIQYGSGIKEINTMMCKILRHYSKDNSTLRRLDVLCKGIFEDMYFVDPVFAYGFPKDKTIELQNASEELRLGLNTRRRIINGLSTDNTSNLMSEIDADKIHQAEIDGKVAALVDAFKNTSALGTPKTQDTPPAVGNSPKYEDVKISPSDILNSVGAT